MAEFSHPVLVRGAYQIVALMQASDHDPNNIAGYTVSRASGAILRQDLTLYEARAWLELLLEDDTMAMLALQPSKPGRVRR